MTATSRYRVLLRLVAMLWALSGAGGPGHAQAASVQADATLQQLDALSAQTGLTRQARSDAFLAILESAFDIDRMAEAAIAPERWGDPAFRTAYRQAFRAHLVYGHFAAQRQGPTASTVLGSREAGDRRAIVIRLAVGSRQREVIWYTCAPDDARICDVETDGQRFSLRQKARFGPAISQLGQDAFLDRLRRGGFVGPG